jgi:uncharacterized protein (TIGR00288 family)
MSTPFARAPHQGVVGPVGSGVHAALLIDFDNVTMGMRSDLSKDLKKLLQSEIIKGKVTVQRAYADWRRYPQYIVPLSEASIDLIFAPAYGSSKKNATDIRMAIDGIELVFTRPEIGTFILLTGDSDFSSLVLKLKEYGKYVIGVGIQESSSDILVQNCDEYYSYTSLTGLRRSSEAERATVDPWVLVEQAVQRMVERDDVMRSDRLKQVMIEIDPGFDEGDFGYSKFSRFIAEAASKGLVQLTKLENGQYEVGPAGSGRGDGRRRRDEARDSKRSGAEGQRETREQVREREQPRGRAARERATEGEERGAPATPESARAHAAAPSVKPADAGASPLREAYGLLVRALGALKEQGREGVRDSDVKRRMLELDPSFDEAELGFGKFTRFLRQAHDHEVVNLNKQEGGNYEVSLPGAQAVRALAPQEGAARDQATGERPAWERAAGELTAVERSVAERPGAERQAALELFEPVRPESPPSSGTGLGPRRGSTRRRHEPGPPSLLPGQSAGPPAAGERVEPAALGLPTEPEAQVRYLTHYRGVGRKTAEAVVESFGSEVFSVLQSEPQRLEDVVPAARAQQILEAWKEDYARRLGSRVGPQAAGAPTPETPPVEGGSPGGDQPQAGQLGRRRTRRGGRRGGGRERTG